MYGYDDNITNFLSGLNSIIQFIAFIIMIIGFIECLFGYKLKRFTVAVGGFFVGLILVPVLGYEFFLENSKSVSEALGIAFSGGVIGGIIVANISFKLYKLGLFLTGFSNAYIISLFLFILGDVVSSSNSVDTLIFLAAIPAAVAGYLIVKFAKPLIIIITSIGGAAYASIGLSYLIGDGGTVIFIFLSALGLFYQYKSNNGFAEETDNIYTSVSDSTNTSVSNKYSSTSGNLNKQSNSALNYTPLTQPKTKTGGVIQERQYDEELPKIDD